MPARSGLCVRVLYLVSLWFVFTPLRVAGQTPMPELSSLPLAFESNQGQAPSPYQFVARRNSMQTFFAADGVDVVLGGRGRTPSRVHITWSGAKEPGAPIGEEALPGHSNYLRGAEPAKWIKNIPQFARVRYSSIYPNIDLVFHGHGSTLEHDFLVQPGGDVSRIALRVDKPGHIDPSGDLLVGLGEDQLRFVRPVAYQMSGEVRKEVAANFVMIRDGEIHFKIGEYDHAKPLIIDPVFAFSTYLDGSLSDNITAVTTDAAGDIYVAGSTVSTDFPITNAGNPLCAQCSETSGGNSEAFVSKLDPTGHTLMFSSYLGGSHATGGFGTFASSIGLDKNDNIYVAGVTSSWDFPHAGALVAYSPQYINGDYFFVSSLKADGSGFNYSGLVGGQEGIYTDGESGKLAVDANGNAYLAGTTDDVNFELTPGAYSTTPTSHPYDTMFVLRLDATGKLVYSTLVPGNVTPRPVGTAYADNFVAHGISVDGNGQVTIAGLAGMGLPTTPGVLEATMPSSPNNPDPQLGFLLQLNATGSKLNFATYLPGADTARGMTVDGTGNFYIVGMTSQTNLPVGANAYQKAIISSSTCTCNAGYVLKVDSQGKTALGATYLSGASGASFRGVAVDSKGNVSVGGSAFGSDFPMRNPFLAMYEITGSIEDMVIAELTPDLSSLLFGSYLSSTSASAAYPGSRFSGMALDSNDKLFIVGTTSAVDFPTTAGSYQTAPPPSPNPPTGYTHSFVSKLDLSIPAPSVCLSTTSLYFGAVLIGTSSTMNLGITNCGNAALQVSSATSSLASFVAGQNCASVAIGSTCNLQVTFTPTDSSMVQGTLTLTDNAAIPQQTVTLSGKGGNPQVYFPDSLTMADLLVGTQAGFYPLFSNNGDGAWIVSNVVATGDFAVDNQCNSAVPPNGACSIGIIFAPKEIGLRSGSLKITDNTAGSPHVIQLSGNSFSAYTTPSILGITAVAMDAPSPTLWIAGNNFFPASQVLVNGLPRTTSYSSEGLLLATLTGGDVAQAGELAVTVSNPSPGGGTSNSYAAPVYSAIRNTSFLHAVYDAKSGHIYASVNTVSTNYANQVIVIDPASAKVLSSWSVGNGPNQLVISDDGQFLYVGLDGDKKVAQVALPSGTVNFAAGLGNEPASQTPMIAKALAVLPGQPHSWAVTLCVTGQVPCGNGVAIFDDETERPTIAAGIEPDVLVFVGRDATTMYGTTFRQSPPSFYKFAIAPTGISLSQTATDYSGASPGGETLDSDGTSIYVSNGQVIDPSTLDVKNGGFAVWLSGSSIRVDVPSSRVYFSGQSSGEPFPSATSSVRAFDLGSQQLVASLGTQEYLNAGPEMYRWGTNGLEVGASGAMLFFQTSLTSKTAPSEQFFVSAVTPMVIPVGSTDQTVTISGGGFSTGDTVNVNGVQLVTSGVTTTQITATIPESLLAAAGDLQLVVADTNHHVAYLELVISPGKIAVSLSTNVLNFAAQNVGTSSNAQTVTLTNAGSAALVISSVSASGDFGETNNCTTVATGASCTISVTFTPSGAGTRSGTLQITDNDVTKSQTVTLSGIGSDVQIAGSSGGGTSETVKRGVAASYGLTITPQNGFTGAVSFSCTNLPQYASCMFSPSSATLGASALNVTVTINTQQQQTAALYPGGFAKHLIGCLACVVLLPFGIRRYRRVLRRHVTLGLLLVALVLLPLGGCGGGGSSANPPPQTTLYTPSGTYAVTFNVASGGFSHSIPLTLVVTD